MRRSRPRRQLTTPQIMHNWLKNLVSAPKDAPEPPDAAPPPPSPDHAKESAAHKKRGDELLNQGRFAEAAESYRQAIDLNPRHAEAFDNLGIALWEQKHYQEAERCLKEAIRIAPGVANTCYNLGSLLQEQGRPEEALHYFELAIQARPYFAEAYHYRGMILDRLGRHAEAASCFLIARTQAVNQFRQVCDWRNMQADIQAVRRAVLDASPESTDLLRPFFFISMPGITAGDQKRYAEKYARAMYGKYAAERSRLGFDFRRAPHDRIRIGYLSSDFHDHATAKLMVEMFELHDRDRFHIAAYSHGPDDASAMRARLEHAFDDFVELRHASHETAARKIYGDRVDILVDLKGYTQDNRCEILALRPAPIQVNYLGYPGTMGADFIDYVIADGFIIPPEMEQDYTERVIRLDDCYQPNDRTRPLPAALARAECGLPEKGFVFCCFNQTYKITPEVFEVWCELLKAVPESCLWLWMSNPDAAPNLRREAAARGINPDRIIPAPTIADVHTHLARLQCADLFLDTLPVNAHTTCSDALWVGLPVVTCAGSTFPSRVAGSLLMAMGVPELVTHDLRAYFRLALDLATDRARLDTIRRKLVVNRDTAPLFDTKRFAASLERAYIRMMNGAQPSTDEG